MPPVEAGSVRFLSSDAGARALAAAREARSLPVHRRAKALAGLGSPEEIRAALVQDDLRVRAAERCPHAERLLFLPEALEQATAWPVAAERATRWPGEDALADLGAGIGLDALATALAGRAVEAYERDPARAALLTFNAAALGVAERVRVHADDVLAAAAAGRLGGANAYLDPDRRPGGARTRDPEAFEPPAAAWPALLGGFARAMIKLPPVVEGALPLEGPQEVVSLGGRARERRLLVGDWPARAPRRALALPSGLAVEGEGVAPPEPVAVDVGAWILDPDVSVTLAGLVGDLARRDGLAPLAAGVAYLVGEAPSEGAPGHWVRVDAVLEAKPKALNRWLRAEGVGNLTIRKRGIEAKAEDWRRRLRPAGPNAGTLVFTHDRDGRWVVYASRES